MKKILSNLRHPVWAVLPIIFLFMFFSNNASAQAEEIRFGYSGNPALDWWLDHGYILSLALLALGVVIFFGTIVTKMFISQPKSKYDYINGPQHRLYVYSAYSLNFAFLAFLLSTVLSGRFNWIYFIAQVVTSILMVGLLHFTLRFTFKFYYPTLVEKKLKKLRYKPRKTKNGDVMELLSEEEEDDYLDEGMQAEEEALAVDYDVWIHRPTGETRIEKYGGYSHALKCPNCTYQTYKLVKEEIISKPTHKRSGKSYKFYNCTYCGHKGKRAHVIHPTHQTKSYDPQEDPDGQDEVGSSEG
jgi:hypothetical protein